MEELIAKECKLTLTDGGATLVHPGQSALSGIPIPTHSRYLRTDDAPFAPTKCPEVFTHFRKAVEGLREQMVRPVIPTPDALPSFPASARDFLADQHDDGHSRALADLDGKYEARSTIPFTGGEPAALERLEHYCSSLSPSFGPPGGSSSAKRGDAEPALFTYKSTRNALTGADGSSHFSPFLSVGALSARQAYWRIKRAEDERQGGGNGDSYWLVFELLWRDYWKFVARGPLGDDRIFKLYGIKSGTGEHAQNDKVAKGGKGSKGSRKGQRGEGHMGGRAELRQAQRVPPRDTREWSHDPTRFAAWRDGTTGVPFIDANMRELAATGTSPSALSPCSRQHVGLRRIHEQSRAAERRRFPRGSTQRRLAYGRGVVRGTAG
jgi:deoxyribodipyrimidine photo-lyase